METSVDNRGKVHFRRRRVSGPGSVPDLTVPLDDLNADDRERKRFVERFKARDIKFGSGDGTARDSLSGIDGLEPADVKSTDLPERSSRAS